MVGLADHVQQLGHRSAAAGVLPSSFDIESSDARVAVAQKILANRDVQLTVWEDGPDDDDEP